ncbi:MAG: PIG-L family deacetylase [Anaerolineales bacterium]|nr:PIG-L family deacetylase [Anaerolineales bacterium]MCS7247580.1 PIG-L family deacetylase [Anaerolineales bacterium]MDW8161391.1 PIG-L family deacetylase [Anaerolineales bacterium]MDW8448000.1 PIG-L family deacetylase [Anaerolineales bacterium]
MRWVFLSPHYDDAVFSCGGGIWELCQAGEEVEVWTVCGGQPPQNAKLSAYAEELHLRWGFSLEAVEARKAEDAEALSQLGAVGHSFQVPDCIYRASQSGEPLYTSDEELFSKLHPLDRELIQTLCMEISQKLSGNEKLVCPLGVGNHVDHQLTRLAAERVGLPLLYYAEIPYIFRHPEWQKEFLSPKLNVVAIPISEKGFEHWLDSVTAYRSQLSTFWENETHLYQTFHSYWQANPILELWSCVGV